MCRHISRTAHATEKIRIPTERGRADAQNELSCVRVARTVPEKQPAGRTNRLQTSGLSVLIVYKKHQNGQKSRDFLCSDCHENLSAGRPVWVTATNPVWGLPVELQARSAMFTREIRPVFSGKAPNVPKS